MTRQETFKKRIRARMEKTGEKYNAARRSLLRNPTIAPTDWVSDPETSDRAVLEATGRGWSEWREILDSWQGDTRDHGTLVSYLQSEHGIDGWWSQSVAVGYERITGIRLPYQRPDGTFTASKSRTLAIDGTVLREMLLDDQERAGLFPGFETELRSKATSKDLRVAIGEGVALFTIRPQDDGRSKVTVTHEKLESLEDVELWKGYWSEWLDTAEES